MPGPKPVNIKAQHQCKPLFVFILYRKATKNLCRFQHKYVLAFFGSFFFCSKKAVVVTLGTHFYASSVLLGCDLQLVTCDLRPVTCNLWPVTCNLWPVTCDLWPATCDLWPAKETCRNTACRILWHSLSKFVLSLGSGFSRHPGGLSFSGLSFRDTQRVWVFRVWVFETPRGSEFLGSEFSRHPEGLSF